MASFNTQATELKRVYGSVSAGYGDWNKGFVNVGRGEVWKAVADFGAVFDKGEFSSFYEMNVLNHPVDGRNHTTQFLGHYRLFESDVTLMGKLYMSMENKFGDELNMLYGLGYLGLTGKSGFIKPYIAVHNLSNDYNSKKYGMANGWNGYVLGWVAAYHFNLFGEKFTISDWNEIEFDRNDAYAEQQGGHTGLSGAVTLTWRFMPQWKASVSYRYFNNKLGYKEYGDRINYLIGFEF
ncbi:outer membrane protein OmpK [Phytobacter sp. AG2a]